MNKHNPFVIGITGGSASGKSTFARLLKKEFQQDGFSINIINQDDYYLPLDHLTHEERIHINFDHPASIDFELLNIDLAKLIEGQDICSPVYSFENFNRTTDCKKISPADIIILEGMLILTDSELAKKIDLKIYIDEDDDIRVLRRLERDQLERGRSQEQIIHQYLTFVKPMHNQFVLPMKEKGNIIVRSNSIQESLQEIKAILPVSPTEIFPV